MEILQPSSSGSADELIYDQLAAALESEGYAQVALLPAEVSDSLFRRCLTLKDEDFRRAGIGREGDYQLNRFVRTDEIRWLRGDDVAEAAYLTWMERLRLALNRRLFLGLFDFECHFARYQSGAYYKRHVDAFQGSSNRVLSTVFYLNPGWTSADGGELLLYPSEDARVPLLRVLPHYGSLVIFLSERFPHEVLPSQRERYSVAGWFRVNNSLGGMVDPAR